MEVTVVSDTYFYARYAVLAISKSTSCSSHEPNTSKAAWEVKYTTVKTENTMIATVFEWDHRPAQEASSHPILTLNDPR